jgi:hypothetical protein
VVETEIRNELHKLESAIILWFLEHSETQSHPDGCPWAGLERIVPNCTLDQSRIKSARSEEFLESTYPITTSVVDDSSVWQVRSGGTPCVAWNGNWANRVGAQVVLPGVSVGPVQKELRGTHVSPAGEVRVLKSDTVDFQGFLTRLVKKSTEKPWRR